MSKSVDQRIVEMQFNNRNFESGVKESIRSLDRLKNGLDLKGAHKSLNDLQAAGQRFSLAGIAQGVDLISSRFTLLGMVGVTALQNIVNSAVNAGKTMVKALTLDPILTGFKEFELKMGSIQTIMAGSGETLEVVNEQLNELNKYSDKTIYSFSDMTTNIGKFTNAGVNLKESVAAIKGIANAAALSGANAEEASRSMYNFAQALSGGFVKLIDWKSIELANMATVEFKNQLIQGAVAAGTLRDAGNGLYETYNGNLISATKGFNDSLQDQWMTSEVLIDVLNKYADETTEIGKRATAAAQDIKTFSMMFDSLKEAAQSGWAETWETIVGNFEEGKKLWTELGGVIGGYLDRSADARNETLKFWKEYGGREDLIIGIKNAFNGLYSVLKPIGEAFRQIFPATTGLRLAELSKGFREFTEKLKMGAETATNVKSTFAGLFAILSIGKELVMAVARNVGILFDILTPPGESSLFKFTAMIGEWLVALDSAIKKGDVFYKVINDFARAIAWFDDILDAAVASIINVLTSFNDVDMTGTETLTQKLASCFEPLGKMFEGINGVFSGAVAGLKETAPVFYNLVSLIGQGITELQRKLIEALNNGAFSSILDIFNTGLFAAILVSVTRFTHSFANITGNLSDALENVKEVLVGYQMSLKAEALLKIAVAIGILAVSLMVLASIDQAKLSASLAAIGILFAQLFGSLSVYATFINPKSMFGLMAMSVTMVGISTAILILAAAMKKLSSLEWDGVEKGLISVGAMMAMLIATSKALSANTAFIIRGTASIILFAVAINILASAVKRLGEIDAGSLTKGLTGLWVILGALTKFMKTNAMNKLAIAQSTSIFVLAIALNVLAGAVRKLGSIDLKDLAKGLISVGVILTSLTLFINAVPDSKSIIPMALSLVILGGAMNIFANAIIKMGEMSWGEMSRGLISFGASLAIITVALNALPKNIFIKSLAIIDVAAAIMLLSKALKSMAALSWDEIARGLTALGVSLGIIIGAFVLLDKTSSMADSLSFTILALGITILANALKTLGSMSLAQIGIALVGLAGAFTVIGIAATVLTPLTPAILALSVAVAILGAGMLAAGLGLSLFAAGFAALAVAGGAGVATLLAMVTGLIGLIPFVIEQVGIAIVLFAGVITTGMPAIMEAVGAIFAGIIKLIGELTPSLIKTILDFVLELLKQLASFIPQFIDTGIKLIIGFLKGIADNITEVVKVGVDVVLNFLEGIKQKMPEVINMAFTLIITFINGLADAIRTNHQAFFNAVRDLMMSIIEAMTSFLWLFPKLGVDIIKGLISGIKSMAGDLVKAAKGVVSDAIQAAKNLLDIRSPSKVFYEIGTNVGKGMVLGLDAMGNKVSTASGDLAKSSIDGMNRVVQGIQDFLNMDVNLQPTIRPVVDMTDVQNGLNRTFGGTHNLDVAGSIDRTASISKSMGKTTGNNVVQQSSSKSITNEFKIASLSVREEADIRKIARQLYQLQLAGSRG